MKKLSKQDMNMVIARYMGVRFKPHMRYHLREEMLNKVVRMIEKKGMYEYLTNGIYTGFYGKDVNSWPLFWINSRTIRLCHTTRIGPKYPTEMLAKHQSVFQYCYWSMNHQVIA